MQESHTPFGAGEQIMVRDEPWTVVGAEPFETVRLVHLRGLGDDNRGELRSVITPFDTVNPVAASTRLHHRSRRCALATVASALADAAPWNECWAAAAASIDLRAWQLEPAKAAIAGATRILLADHVGLGKTIQATLIVAELGARGLAQRVLVLTPAALREQWAGEMTARFGLAPVVYDQATLFAMATALPAGVNPWQTTPLIVSSIDLVKRPEVRAAIDGVVFDVLVVDEAHHLTPGTDRGAVVADIASRTPWVVLATATPHSGDDAAYDYLRRIGKVGDDELAIFRRSASQLTGRAPRRSRTLAVAPTDAERNLLDATNQYVRAIGRAAQASTGAVLVASVIARRAASSAQAVAQTLRRRLALLSRDVEPAVQSALPWEDCDAADADVSDAVLAVVGLSDTSREVRWLNQLIAFADLAAESSSKIGVIRRLLRRTVEQVLVFSEYRDVALLVADAVSDVSSVSSLHGGLSPRDRREVVQAFNGGHVRTLVCTDAAGEGLNLHARCRLVVNMELPWTPLRLEQRIGRVDRIGQPKRVHVIHLVHRQSFEGTVVARLERRRAHARARDNEAPVREGPSAAAVERQLRQVAAGYGAAPSAGSVYASRTLRLRPARRIVLVHSVLLLDDNGRVVQREVIPLAVTPPPMKHSTRLTRSLLRRLVGQPMVQEAIRCELSRVTSRGQGVTASVAAALQRRLAACLKALDGPSDDVVWQGSLFDRRAERQARLRLESVASQRRQLERARASASALAILHASQPRLVAAWLGD